jgi:hypothetical protein
MTTKRALDKVDPAGRYGAGIGTVLLLGLGLLLSNVVAAQSQAPADNGVQVGDHWTYDQRDEITGSPTTTFTDTVTDVSPTEFVVRITNQGKSGSSIRIYDHDWNLIDRGNFKFKPNNGGGINPPLTVGKEWRSEHETRSTQSSYAAKTSVVAKVTAQEMITTSAGTFETFKIERRMREVSSADPSKSSEDQITGWYAPQINHWVRRLFVTRIQKRLTSSLSEELISFGRKQ